MSTQIDNYKLIIEKYWPIWQTQLNSYETFQLNQKLTQNPDLNEAKFILSRNSIHQLQSIARQMGMPSKGNKEELISVR